MTEEDDVNMAEVHEVMQNLKSPLVKLRDDVVCAIPDPKIKDVVRKKFATAEGPIESVLREQDHTQCQQRISELEGIVVTKDATIQSEQEKVEAYAGTIKLFRDELHKKGAVRPSLSERLQQLGFCAAAPVASTSASSSTTVVVSYSFDVAGTLLDFSASCHTHKSLRLNAVTANVPPSAILWAAKNVYELAQGLEVSESLQLSDASRALYFVNNSPLASTNSFEKPTSENLVRVMVKLTSACQERSAAFAKALLVAERVRAELDGKKSLRGEPVLVLGGNNTQLLADFLGATFVEAPTVPDLRSFFEAIHFQATVLRVFVWLDIDNEQFMLAQQSQLVPALRDIVANAAQWGHVQFIVLPTPYAHCLLPVFEAFMEQFNSVSVNIPNVLWLNDSVRVDGARFAHSLGSNAFVTYWTAVDQKGHLSRRSIRAALRFLRQLKPSLVPDEIDLSDPVKPEHPSLSEPSSYQQSTSSSSSSALHGVHHGGILKHPRGGHSARVVPLKRGGSGSRGKWNPNNRRGQGHRRS